MDLPVVDDEILEGEAPARVASRACVVDGCRAIEEEWRTRAGQCVDGHQHFEGDVNGHFIGWPCEHCAAQQCFTCGEWVPGERVRFERCPHEAPPRPSFPPFHLSQALATLDVRARVR